MCLQWCSGGDDRCGTSPSAMHTPEEMRLGVHGHVDGSHRCPRRVRDADGRKCRAGPKCFHVSGVTFVVWKCPHPFSGTTSRGAEEIHRHRH